MELIGQKFGKLTVIERGERKEEGKRLRPTWVCLCECGKQKTIIEAALIRGSTKSCGCLVKESNRNRFRDKPSNRRLEQGQSAFNSLLRGYRNGAERRGYDFLLTEDEFSHLTQGDCFYCGAKPAQKLGSAANHGSIVYNGIDRVVNEVGYTLENCVTCCGECNRMKGVMSSENFILHVRGIYERMMRED